MSSVLAQQLRGIIEGPLGTNEVAEDTVSERVGMVEQNERRHVFGVIVYRDGDDQYFVNDSLKPVTRRDVVEAVKGHLEANGRLLNEKLDFGAMMALSYQQKAADDAEKKIGETFKRVADRYVKSLNRMTGANWRVVSASPAIFSLDSDESPKRAIDIYWEYDPGSQTATIYVEGPRGKQKAYSHQKMKDISRLNYIDWLSSVLKEDMDQILAMAIAEETDEPEEAPGVTKETKTRQSFLEEVRGIVDEAVVFSSRRDESDDTKVSDLFEQLVMASKRGDDLDSVINVLRHEGVPEKHINYAIEQQKIPYIYT